MTYGILLDLLCAEGRFGPLHGQDRQSPSASDFRSQTRIAALFAILTFWTAELRIANCESQPNLLSRAFGTTKRVIRGPKLQGPLGTRVARFYSKSGKSKWRLSNGGLGYLSSIVHSNPTIVIILRREWPVQEGPKGQMCRIADDCARVAESGLRAPSLESPH